MVGLGAQLWLEHSQRHEFDEDATLRRMKLRKQAVQFGTVGVLSFILATTTPQLFTFHGPTLQFVRILRPTTIAEHTAAMISDNDLYTLAISLGCVSAALVVVYHFIEVNASAISKYESEGSQESSKAQNAAR
ncbi:hypothetical protein jhhlp_004362 [Lomentospora prolificans]|uniref:Dolichyl-diphosphooligosaccharide--protein glycosyltransferase subunit 4 n=1 Tax=Lomentospora prolificans TaxID=41688 RepID=A0A2N3NBF1_9PEZI|nr:hypothetical protein jhhlp_004362 [Lomentospora prolificans]